MRSQPRPRRSSASVTLVLIGTAALCGCGEETARHDVYRTRADCLQDWGQENKCEAVRSGPHTGFYYGPGFRSGDPAGTGLPRSGSHALAAAYVPRGGFGASATAHGVGGSSGG